MELPVTKSPKIAQFSVGHDGSHALLVAEDGSVFFTGSASKGEDGESSKLISQLFVSFLDDCCITRTHLVAFITFSKLMSLIFLCS